MQHCAHLECPLADFENLCRLLYIVKLLQSEFRSEKQMASKLKNPTACIS